MDSPALDSHTLLVQADELNGLRRYDQALELSRRAAALEPNTARPLCSMAISFNGKREYLRGVEAAEEATRLEPNFFLGHELRCISLCSLAGELPRNEIHEIAQSAVESALNAVRLAPNRAESHAQLAQAWSLLRNFKRADDAVQNAITLGPNNVDTWIAASVVAMRAKNWNAAVDASQRALAIDPNNFAALNNLGVSLRVSGQQARGSVALTEAARQNPNALIVRANISRAGLVWVRGALLVVLLPLLAIPHVGLPAYAGFIVASNAALSSRNFVLSLERWTSPLVIFVSRRTTKRQAQSLSPRRGREEPLAHDAAARSWSALRGRHRVRTSIYRFVATLSWLLAIASLGLVFVPNGGAAGAVVVFTTFALIAIWPTTVVRRRRRTD